MQNKYTIIIPVFGALEHVKKCIDSVLRNTPSEVGIIVIDDASKEGDVIRYLDEVWNRSRLCAVFHAKNLGFVRTANEGIQRAIDRETDPILLNSDTIVPPGWVERLDEARRSNTKCCSVSPLSNECCQYSVPNQGSNVLPKGVDVETMDRIVQETSSYAFPVVPCSIGFCMLMTREAIAAVGVFDTKWGKGYGEETDWCQRARAAGFECVLADNLFVYHKHKASFGKQSIRIRNEHQEMFVQQYPEFLEELARWTALGVQRYHRQSIANRLRPRLQGEKKLKVLYVCHHWGEVGGLEVFAKRLVEQVATELEITVIYPRASRRDWGDQVEDGLIYQDANGVMRIVMSPRLVQSKVSLGLFPFDFEAQHVEDFFQLTVRALAPDVVHFHHLGGYGTFKLPEIVRHEGAKVVLSVHDDFYLCPSYITAGWSCGRTVAQDCEQCRACVSEHSDVLVEGTYDWGAMLGEREQRIIDMFSKCDSVVYPSEATQDRYRNEGTMVAKRSMVIPHGVPRYPVIRTYRTTDKLRIAWVGGCLNEKGWAAFAEVARRIATDERFELSVLGEWHEHADRRGLEHVTWHGRYEPKELPQLLQSVDLAIPAVAKKEAFGLVVSECLAAGCPMLLPSVPTIFERFGEGRPYYTWGSADSLLEELERFHEIYGRSKPDENRNTRTMYTRSMLDCATDYLQLYRELVR